MQNHFTHDAEVYTSKQVAQMLGLSMATLKDWRRRKRIDFITLPSGRVRYRPEVIEEMMKKPQATEANNEAPVP